MAYVRCGYFVGFLLLYMPWASSKGDDFKPVPIRSGPWVPRTQGEIWPKPVFQQKLDQFFQLDPDVFQFQLNERANNCPVITSSLGRFYHRMFPTARRRLMSKKRLSKQLPHFRADSFSQGFLDSVTLNLESGAGCEHWPTDAMNETYEILLHPLDATSRYIQAPSVWGILRGLESFSQMVYMEESTYIVNATQIIDQPRFSYRGYMLDTSRHFYTVKSIIDTLDLMEMNKMNVFHWHIVDNQAFPYQSIRYPGLSEHGAYDPITHVYSQEDVTEIIEAARIRGIRVIPEFDTPGHTQSWELGHPGLLSKCYSDGLPNGMYGPINPTKASSYQFIGELYGEIGEVFPDDYVHVGGDEVDLNCWINNPGINQVMDAWNITGDYKKLESYYIETILNIVDQLSGGKTAIVWEEVFTNGDEIKPNTIVQAWKNWGTGWRILLEQITGAGYRALLSAPWYLNYINYGSDWVEMYQADPYDIFGTDSMKSLILGGEACMWSEFVNSVNLIPRSWPRASAVAERLWSERNVKDIDEAAARLQEHECRMLQRGYPVEPVVGAGYCPIKV